MICLLWRRFRSDYTLIGRLHNMSVTITPLGISCHVGHSCSSYPQQDRATNSFPPLTICTELSDTTETSAQREGFWSDPSQIY